MTGLPQVSFLYGFECFIEEFWYLYGELWPLILIHNHYISACCVPVSLQVEDLKWEVEQRQREIETQKQQLEMVEQCHHREMDTLQDTLQVGYASQPLLSEHALWLFSSEFCLIWSVEDKGGAGDGAGRAQWHTEG